MKKTFLKLTMLFFILAIGAMIFLFAQKGYFSPSADTKKNDIGVVEEQVEDIGQPVDDDPWKEMDKLVVAYYHKQAFSYKGIVKLIDDNGEKEKIIEENNFEYTALGKNIHYKLGQIEIINKYDLLLVADHANKFITVSPVIPVEDKTGTGIFFDIALYKKMMEERKAEVKLTQLGNQRIMTIENIQDPQVQAFRIYYDPETYRISKMLIGMIRLSPIEEEGESSSGIPGKGNEKNTNTNTKETESDEAEIATFTYYMEIIYTEMKLTDMRLQAFNPENKFIIRNNNKIELTAAFSTYQLINHSSDENETQDLNEEQ